MGTDIHSIVEVRGQAAWREVEYLCPGSDVQSTDEPFGERWYGVFGFLADVRNYSCITPITSEPRGLPKGFDISAHEDRDYWQEFHSHSWLLVKELLEYDYDQEFEDRRDHGDTVPEGQGEKTTVREFLGERYFEHLAALRNLADSAGGPERVRIVFWFD